MVGPCWWLSCRGDTWAQVGRQVVFVHTPPGKSPETEKPTSISREKTKDRSCLLESGSERSLFGETYRRARLGQLQDEMGPSATWQAPKNYTG